MPAARKLAALIAAPLAGLIMSLALQPAAALPRSRAVIDAFRQANPCPATGLTHGACPGYQVDHIEALVCGGRDELDNLHWLDIESHKAKTRVEVKLCRSHKKP